MGHKGMEAKRMTDSTNKTLDIETCIEVGWGMLSQEVLQFLENGQTSMKFWVMGEDRSIDVVLVGPAEMEDWGGLKDTAVDFVRDRAAANGAVCVFCLSDTFYGEIPDGATQTLCDFIASIGVQEAAKLNLCVMREAVLCQVITPLETATLHQFYRRVDERIVLEEKKLSRTNAETGGGRLSSARIFPAYQNAARA